MKNTLSSATRTVICLLLVSIISVPANAQQSVQNLFRQGIYYYDSTPGFGASCGLGGSALAIGDATELLANIPDEARAKFETQFPKVQLLQARYQEQSTKNNVPWEIFAALHYREGSNNENQTVLNGQQYGERNVDNKGVISTVDQDYQAAADTLRGLAKVYGVSTITNDSTYTTQDLAKMSISYNRGNVYKRAYGQEEGPWYSPYVANFLDSSRIRMRFPGPTVNGVNIESSRTAGKEDSNLGFITFILLLYEKTGTGVGQISGVPSGVITNDPTNPCAQSGGAVGTSLGDVMYYSQRDPKWAEYPYPYPGDPNNQEDRTIVSSGCGPTSMAMVIATLTTNKSIDPTDLADENLAGGHRGATGTNWSAFTSVLPRYGLEVTQISSTDTETLAREIRSGALAIASFGPGSFTSGGHLLVVRGVTETGSFLVADPNDGNPGSPDYQRKSKTEWAPSVFSGEAKAYFIVKKAGAL